MPPGLWCLRRRLPSASTPDPLPSAAVGPLTGDDDVTSHVPQETAANGGLAARLGGSYVLGDVGKRLCLLPGRPSVAAGTRVWMGFRCHFSSRQASYVPQAGWPASGGPFGSQPLLARMMNVAISARVRGRDGQYASLAGGLQPTVTSAAWRRLMEVSNRSPSSSPNASAPASS